MSRVHEMAQWRKVLKAVAAKADHFHAIPGTHMMGRANIYIHFWWSEFQDIKCQQIITIKIKVFQVLMSSNVN